MRRRIAAFAAAALVVLTAGLIFGKSSGKSSGGKDPSSGKPAFATIERNGLAIEFALEPVKQASSQPLSQTSLPTDGPWEGAATIRVTDAATGEPIKGLRPVAWMSEQGTSRITNDKQCREKVKTYLGGLLSEQADVDLNSYLLLTLNRDNTISVINPQISFRRTKLRNLVTLSSNPGDWLLTPDGKNLLVTLPAADRLAIIETVRFRVTGQVRTGRGPRRLEISRDGRTVFVANDGDGTVSAIDLGERKELARIAAGAGEQELGWARDGRELWVLGKDEASISIIDPVEKRKVGTIAADQGMVAVAASQLARFIYVANSRTGEITAFQPSGAEARAAEPAVRIRLQPGVAVLRFDPSGRWLFALNPVKGTVSIIDSSNSRMAHVITGFKRPDQVSFTTTYAYIRNARSHLVSMIDLGTLINPGMPGVQEIPVGSREPLRAQESPGGAAIVATPEPGAVLIAHSADRSIFFYTEGMMAPMGSHPNYGREPRAALLLDRSLKEAGDGRYTARVSVPVPGKYDVEILLAGRKTAGCLEWTVEPWVSKQLPRKNEGAISLVPDTAFSKKMRAGETRALRFALTTAEGGGGSVEADDLAVMLFRAPAGRQWRLTPVRESSGQYRVNFVPPEAGQYRFLVGIPSRGKPFGAIPPLDIHVEGKVKK